MTFARWPPKGVAHTPEQSMPRAIEEGICKRACRMQGIKVTWVQSRSLAQACEGNGATPGTQVELRAPDEGVTQSAVPQLNQILVEVWPLKDLCHYPYWLFSPRLRDHGISLGSGMHTKTRKYLRHVHEPTLQPQS